MYLAALVLVLLPLVLAACAPKEDAATTVPVAPETTPPGLSVEEPARASFVGEVDDIVLAGTARPKSGRLTTLTVNGVEMEVSAEGGTWSGEVPAVPGVNILGSRVETADGERAVDGRAVMAGPVHPPGARLSHSVRMQIGPEALDDDRADIDDLAAIAEALLAEPGAADALVGRSFTTEDYVLTVTDASFGGTDVDLLARSGRLDAGLDVHDVWIAFHVTGVGWYDWLETDGTAWADVAEVALSLSAAANDGRVTTSVSESDVNLVGYGLTVEWFPDGLEDDLADWTREDLEIQMADATSAQVQELLGGYLEAFNLESEVSGLRLHFALDTLEIATDGLRLGFDAWTEGDIGLDLPSGAGSLETAGDGPDFPLTTTAPFAIAADDDFLNQLLFNLWASGAMSDITFGGAELTLLVGNVPPPLGPVAETRIHVDLPPTIGPASEKDQQVDLALGEMRMIITREDGVVIDASVNVRTGATLGIDDASALGFSLDDRPSAMVLEVGMVAWPEALDPGDVAALMRLSVPPMLGTLSALLPGYPLPSIPLDSFGLEGESLVPSDPEVRVDSGWLVVEAGLGPG